MSFPVGPSRRGRAGWGIVGEVRKLRHYAEIICSYPRLTLDFHTNKRIIDEVVRVSMHTVPLLLLLTKALYSNSVCFPPCSVSWLSSHHRCKITHVCMPLRICYATWAAHRPPRHRSVDSGVLIKSGQSERIVARMLYCTRGWVSNSIS